jgi:hypothetical protein
MTNLITQFGHVKEVVDYSRGDRNEPIATVVLSNGDVIDIPTDETVVAQAMAVSA